MLFLPETLKLISDFNVESHVQITKQPEQITSNFLTTTAANAKASFQSSLTSNHVLTSYYVETTTSLINTSSNTSTDLKATSFQISTGELTEANFATTQHNMFTSSEYESSTENIKDKNLETISQFDLTHNGILTVENLSKDNQTVTETSIDSEFKSEASYQSSSQFISKTTEISTAENFITNSQGYSTSLNTFSEANFEASTEFITTNFKISTQENSENSTKLSLTTLEIFTEENIVNTSENSITPIETSTGISFISTRISSTEKLENITLNDLNEISSDYKSSLLTFTMFPNTFTSTEILPNKPTDHFSLITDSHTANYIETSAQSISKFSSKLDNICGDIICGFEETCSSCPEDCGACPLPICGGKFK